MTTIKEVYKKTQEMFKALKMLNEEFGTEKDHPSLIAAVKQEYDEADTSKNVILGKVFKTRKQYKHYIENAVDVECNIEKLPRENSLWAAFFKTRLVLRYELFEVLVPLPSRTVKDFIEDKEQILTCLDKAKPEIREKYLGAVEEAQEMVDSQKTLLVKNAFLVKSMKENP